jgi:hypothetical protein
MPSHGLGRRGEKVSAALPLNVLRRCQPEIRFVDECRRLEHVAAALARHVSPGDPAQLRLNRRQQLVQSCVVAGLPREKQLGDVWSWGHLDWG